MAQEIQRGASVARMPRSSMRCLIATPIVVSFKIATNAAPSSSAIKRVSRGDMVVTGPVVGEVIFFSKKVARSGLRPVSDEGQTVVGGYRAPANVKRILFPHPRSNLCRAMMSAHTRRKMAEGLLYVRIFVVAMKGLRMNRSSRWWRLVAGLVIGGVVAALVMFLLASG